MMYYYNMFKENEQLEKEGKEPIHKIYEKLKYVRPIKRKVLVQEIMKMLENEKRSKDPSCKPLDNLDLGLDVTKSRKY